MHKFLLTLAAALLLSCSAIAQESNIHRSDSGSVKLVSTTDAIEVGSPLWLGLAFDLKPGWHIYTDPPGEAGLPPEINWTLPENFHAERIRWPEAKTFVEGEDITTYGYEKKVFLPISIDIPQDVNIGVSHRITAETHWLVCKLQCIPITTSFTLELPVVAAGNAQQNEYADQLLTASAKYKAKGGGYGLSLGIAMLLAFAGGIILNLMPCVFPVLSLKCLALIRHRDLGQRENRLEAIFYTLGVVVAFAVLAIGLIALRSSGEALGWGYQMQSPGFVSVMALLLLLVGLNLSGFFYLPVLLGNVGASLVNERTPKTSFFTGLLAALVATPCTAPLMAPAVGYALTQPPLTTFLVLQALGLGLAAPFLLLGMFPALVHFLPAPGRWMERFKQFLAFPMYLSSLWLFWVLSMQVQSSALALLFGLSLLLVFALWLERGKSGVSMVRRMVVLFLIVIAFATAALAIPRMTENISTHGGENNFTRAELDKLLKENKPVLVNATAAWCITCQVNARTLYNERVQEALEKKNITLMTADWTNRNPEITAFLQEFGYSGVPLYVYYPAEEKPIILPQLLTPKGVLEMINSPGSDQNGGLDG